MVLKKFLVLVFLFYFMKCENYQNWSMINDINWLEKNQFINSSNTNSEIFKESLKNIANNTVLPILKLLIKRSDGFDDLNELDDDYKYDRQNEKISEADISFNNSFLNKSNFENHIVPVFKRMVRRKDLTKKDSEFQKRRGTSSHRGFYNDETTRSSNRVYSDEDEEPTSHQTVENEEEEDVIYEDGNNNENLQYGKKIPYIPNHSNTHHVPSPPVPAYDPYYTRSNNMPNYWDHGNYYHMISHPTHGHGHGYFSKYGKHFYKEEYAILLVVISLAAFLGLIFALFMPYALVQSQAITGVPGNTIPYTNAVNSFSNNQYSNTVSTDTNRIPINLFNTGRKRKKRMINFERQQYLNEQLKNLKLQNLRDKLVGDNKNFDELFDKIFIQQIYNPYFYNNIFQLVAQRTFDIIQNI